MITADEYAAAITTAGIELKQHQDPRLGWCWRIRDLTDWYEPEPSEAAALKSALTWLVQIARTTIEREQGEGSSMNALN